MNIKLSVDGKHVDISITKFPAGESLVRITGEVPKTDSASGWNPSAVIDCDFKSNEDFINIMLLMDAVRREYFNPVNFYLTLPYLPYARQDRVCNQGESLSIKVVADLINSMGFKRVMCMDIHSDVGAALINNLEHHPMLDCADALQNVFDRNSTVLVSPDAGAMKKTLAFAKVYGYPHVICADKQRDTLTGELKSFKVNSDHVGNKDLLVLDDIADGSGTFVGLGQELKKITDGNLYLYVTHGIFSKGIDLLHPIYKKVYCGNMMLEDWKEKDTHGIIEIV